MIPDVSEALERAYPDWEIRPNADGLPVLTAEHRLGTSIRFLVAYNAQLLVAKVDWAIRRGVH